MTIQKLFLPESENSAAILETDDLQDIPEDDDMIVLEWIVVNEFLNKKHVNGK